RARSNRSPACWRWICRHYIFHQRQMRCWDEYQEQCTADSISCRKLFEKHLTAEKIEEKFALAVWQIRLPAEGFDFVATDDIEDGAGIQQATSHFRILDIEKRKNWRVEAHLTAVVEYAVGHDPTHRVTNDGFIK